MSADEIIEAIGGMTVFELVELKKALEEKFGVSAAPVFAGNMGGGGGGGGTTAAPEAEAPTSFNVILTSAGAQKIQVIKAVRELTSLGLKEAKDLVDGAPSPVKEGTTKEDADAIKAKLEEAGASVDIKPA